MGPEGGLCQTVFPRDYCHNVSPSKGSFYKVTLTFSPGVVRSLSPLFESRDLCDCLRLYRTVRGMLCNFYG